MGKLGFELGTIFLPISLTLDIQLGLELRSIELRPTTTFENWAVVNLADFAN